MFKVCVDPKPKLSLDSVNCDYSKHIKLEFETVNQVSSYSLITSKETPRRSALDSCKVKMLVKNENANETRRSSTNLNTTKKLGRNAFVNNEGFKDMYEINKVIKQNKNKKNSWTKKEVSCLYHIICINIFL